MTTDLLHSLSLRETFQLITGVRAVPQNSAEQVQRPEQERERQVRELIKWRKERHK